MNVPGKDFKRGTVAAGEFVLDYAEAGPERPTATIVSLPGSAGLEMSVAKDMLTRSYRVLEINPPGWGGKADVNREMTQKELGGILAEAIGKLVSGAYYLIGTSMGGANALYVAKTAPGKVLGIIHEGSMAPCRQEDLRMPPPDPKQQEAMMKGLDDPTFVYPSPPAHRNKPWATAEYASDQMRNRFKMFRWTQPDFAPTQAIAYVRDNKIPVLALLGNQDQIIKLSQEDAYKAELPQAQFHTVADAEHDIQNSQPEEFVRYVDEFIRATSSS